MNRIYLDHNATTKIRKEVLDEMMSFLVDEFGNPSSPHFFGQKALSAIDQARHRVADFINAKPDEIVFTSGGTEANNLAIMGIALKLGNSHKHIITSSVEHMSVLGCVKYLESRGFRVTYLPVDMNCIIDPDAVSKAITSETILITMMLANNEVGTIEPIKEISEIAKSHGIPVHTDAVQAVGKICVDVNDLNVDMLSLSAHKIYGSKGIGGLYIRKGIKVEPMLHGGHHEKGKRAGTENVAGIVGFGKACEISRTELEKNAVYLKTLRDRLEKGILNNIECAQINGHPQKRVPNTLNVSFKNIGGEGIGEAILINLDLAEIAVSTGSACTSGAIEPSHVLTAMGLPPEEVRSAIRFSLGIENTEEEIDYTISCLKDIVEELRLIKIV